MTFDPTGTDGKSAENADPALAKQAAHPTHAGFKSFSLCPSVFMGGIAVNCTIVKGQMECSRVNHAFAAD
jgi:hypothetical protein